MFEWMDLWLVIVLTTRVLVVLKALIFYSAKKLWNFANKQLIGHWTIQLHSLEGCFSSFLLFPVKSSWIKFRDTFYCSSPRGWIRVGFHERTFQLFQYQMFPFFQLNLENFCWGSPWSYRRRVGWLGLKFGGRARFYIAAGRQQLATILNLAFTLLPWTPLHHSA